VDEKIEAMAMKFILEYLWKKKLNFPLFRDQLTFLLTATTQSFHENLKGDTICSSIVARQIASEFLLS
jgi:hypothetical protein